MGSLQQSQVMHIGEFAQFFDTGIADAAFRHVHDPAEAQVIGWIHNQAQIGQKVFDFFTVVELAPADHLVRDVRLQEVLLDDTRLGVRPIEHCEIPVLAFVFADFLLHLRNDITRFVVFGLAPVVNDVLAIRIVCPQFFFFPVDVILDHVIGCAQDFFGGTVILLQQDHFCVRIVLLEVEDVLHISPAPTVDALIRIADDADVFEFVGQQLHQLVLGVVGILILVHVDVMEFILVVGQRFWVFLEQLDRQHDQVIKIHRLAVFERFLVILVALEDDIVDVSASQIAEFLRCLQLIFCLTDPPQNHAVIVFFGIQILFADDAFHQCFGFALIADGEGARIAELFALSS